MRYGSARTGAGAGDRGHRLLGRLLPLPAAGGPGVRLTDPTSFVSAVMRATAPRGAATMPRSSPVPSELEVARMIFERVTVEPDGRIKNDFMLPASDVKVQTQSRTHQVGELPSGASKKLPLEPGERVHGIELQMGPDTYRMDLPPAGPVSYSINGQRVGMDSTHDAQMSGPQSGSLGGP